MYFQGICSSDRLSDIKTTAPILISNHVLFVIAGQSQYKTLQEFIRVTSNPLPIQVSNSCIGFWSPACILCRAVKAKVVESVQHFCCLASKINVLVAYVLIDNRKFLKSFEKRWRFWALQSSSCPWQNHRTIEMKTI